MRRFDELKNWIEARRDYAYTVMRIYLGIALFMRGLILLSDPSAITTLAGAQQVYMMYSYIIAGHLIGGFLLAIGFMTRLAALLQIPILAGAVFFIHLQQGLMTVGQSLELAALVLALLIIFCLFGSGSYALDNYIGAKKTELSPAVK
ncbi:DoxX family protein [bacterium]|nr:DoxX family protein [bacterium]